MSQPQIHFSELIRSAAESVDKSIRTRLSWFNGNEREVSYSNIKGRIVELVWEGVFKVIDGNGYNPAKGAAEKAVAALLHRGVSRDSVSMGCGNVSKVRLPNLEYRIYKRDPGYAARPWPLSCELRPIALSGDRFADVVLAFDAAIPEIDAQARLLHDQLASHALEIRREIMVSSIKKQYVQSLISQFLEPYGLEVSYKFSGNSDVELDIQQLRKAHLRLPLERLAEHLSDVSAVIDSLETESDTPRSDQPSASRRFDFHQGLSFPKSI